MAIFYHVTNNMKHSGVFTPKVPKSIYSAQNKDTGITEDDQTKRVCVSTSIEGCLTSMPNAGFQLEEFLKETNGRLKIFKIDTQKIGITEKDIVNSEALYKSEKVPDAELTDEHWITTSFEVNEEDSFVIENLQWEEEDDEVIPYKIYKLAEEQYEGDYFKAYFETYQTKIDPIILIEGLTYDKI